MTALFDMDGTLFAGDSQLHFAKWVLRRHPLRWLCMASILPGLLLRLLHIINDEQMKRLFLSYAWRMPADQLRTECRAFVQQRLLPSLYPAVLSRLRDHQAAGHRTVLCSASPDWWTLYVGEELGFTHSIATPVPIGKHVTFLPPIPHPGNNRGHAKITRLAAIGISSAEYAYSDSVADTPMLTLCSHPVLINPNKKLRALFPQAEIITQ